MQQASGSRRSGKKDNSTGKRAAPVAGGTPYALHQDTHLETVLEEWRSDVAALRKHGLEDAATSLQHRVDEVSIAAREYLEWLSESAAMLRSGRAKRWLRERFPEWEQVGHARIRGGHRQYRTIIVPCRRAVVDAYEAGRRAAQEAA
jgi:hypothetical protein